MKTYLVSYINPQGRKKEYKKTFNFERTKSQFIHKKMLEGCLNIKVERVRHSQYDRSLEQVILSKKREYFDSVCIYALIDNNEVVYIGQSSDVMGRLSSHRMSSKNFTHFAIVERIDTKDSDYINKVEREYISKLKPKYNKVGL